MKLGHLWCDLLLRNLARKLIKFKLYNVTEFFISWENSLRTKIFIPWVSSCEWGVTVIPYQARYVEWRLMIFLWNTMKTESRGKEIKQILLIEKRPKDAMNNRITDKCDTTRMYTSVAEHEKNSFCKNPMHLVRSQWKFLWNKDKVSEHVYWNDKSTAFIIPKSNNGLDELGKHRINYSRFES